MIRIYTYGYSGRDVAELTDLADALDAIVIDIRESPQSRVQQWAGWSLKRTLGERYMHVRALGNLNYKTVGTIVLRDASAGLEALWPILAKQSVILLCACKNPVDCHRTAVANLLTYESMITIEHLSMDMLGRAGKRNGNQSGLDAAQCSFDLWPVFGTLPRDK